MVNLVKNSSHGNQISVFKLFDKNLIRKISFQKNNYKYLFSEFNGTKWYEDMKYFSNSLSPNLKESETFLQLDMNMIKGKSVYHLANIDKTKYFLNIFIDHYIDVWEREKIVPCHGDLTFSNILFRGNQPRIIDWEHFSNEGECWGFDLAYLVISSISLPFLDNQRLKNTHEESFKTIWRKLYFLEINKELMSKPFKYFNNIFRNKKHWEKIVNDSPNKLFPINIDKEFAYYIDEKITSKI